MIEDMVQRQTAADFKNLLACIDGWATLTLRSLRPDDPNRELIERLVADAEQGCHLPMTWLRAKSVTTPPMFAPEHQLANLLTVISKNCNAVLSTLAPDDPNRELLENIPTFVERGNALIQQLTSWLPEQEKEWLESTDSAPSLQLHSMLQLLMGKVSDRKLRLFGVACCRRVWHLLSETSREAVEVTERFADETATDEERESTHTAVAAETAA